MQISPTAPTTKPRLANLSTESLTPFWKAVSSLACLADFSAASLDAFSAASSASSLADFSAPSFAEFFRKFRGCDFAELLSSRPFQDFLWLLVLLLLQEIVFESFSVASSIACTSRLSLMMASSDISLVALSCNFFG